MTFYLFGFPLFFSNNAVDHPSYAFKLHMSVNAIHTTPVGRSDPCPLRSIFFSLIDKRNIFSYLKAG